MATKEFKREFSFGKIAYDRNGRHNEVTINLRLRWKKQLGWVFAASGNIWNRRKTDCYSCGQNLDMIMEFKDQLSDGDLFVKIYDIWKDWHLNDMNAGTIKQEAALKAHFGYKNISYDEQVDYLKSIDLYVIALELDPINRLEYRYGQRWLFQKIPDEVLIEITDIMGIKEQLK